MEYVFARPKHSEIFDLLCRAHKAGVVLIILHSPWKPVIGTGPFKWLAKHVCSFSEYGRIKNTPTTMLWQETSSYQHDIW